MEEIKQIEYIFPVRTYSFAENRQGLHVSLKNECLRNVQLLSFSRYFSSSTLIESIFKKL